jgi:hypothetical protein
MEEVSIKEIRKVGEYLSETYEFDGPYFQNE